jgi:ABC-type multidrug transport system ATPase subunit
VIEAIELTSTRRSRHAVGGPVENVSFDVYPGQVTALLGAPGTGKSTVLRLMVEIEPGGGRTLFGGRPYRALKPAVREVGLALNPDAVHPGRTVQAHLQLYAAAGGVPKPRVAEVLEVAGLSTQATVRCGRLDPGQRQRLSIAAALIGDPAALILDEPHALDTHGMSWFHALIRAYAAQGRTVLVAVTDPDTLSGTADHVVVLRRDEHDGISRVIASRSAAEVFDERRATVVQVRSPQAARLAAALEAEGARLAAAGPGALQVRGLDRARIGEVAHVAGVCLHELSEIGHDDDVFGLRPVPRQKELLPGLNRAGAIWHSGVRLVAEEIEEAEVVEVAAEASAEAEVDAGAEAEAEQPAVVIVGAQVPGTVQAEADGQASQGAMTGMQASVEQAAQAVDSSESAANIGGHAQADHQVAQVSGLATGPAEAAANIGAQAQADQQVQADGEAAATIPQSPVAASPQRHAKPSAVGSWRTQGSVAGSRWSAVKGSQQQGPVTRPIATSASGTTEEPGVSATAVRQPAPIDSSAAAPTATPPSPATPSPIPTKPREVHRRTTFGLRWGRSRPQHPAPKPPEPVAVAAPTLVQPPVPFTVASPATEHDAAAEGMTPWRAAAARASQRGQQSASVAEAAPAEQETSA